MCCQGNDNGVWTVWHGIYVSRNVVVDGEPVAVDSMVVIVTVAATRVNR